jgi:hypothetical protein
MAFDHPYHPLPFRLTQPFECATGELLRRQVWGDLPGLKQKGGMPRWCIELPPSRSERHAALNQPTGGIMPRTQSRQPARTASQPSNIADTAANVADETTARPNGHYRTILRDDSTGVELGENMHARKLVFTFTGDPGEHIKKLLSDSNPDPSLNIGHSFYYQGKTKEWVSSGDSQMKSFLEQAKKLHAEFVKELGGEQGRGR